MPMNIEIKAKYNHDQMKNHLSKVPHSPQILISQTDTYFNTPDGSRLKLREEKRFSGDNFTHLDGDEAILVHYKRSDEKGPKMSEYTKTPVPLADVEQKIESLKKEQNGLRGVVKKNRILVLIESNFKKTDKEDDEETPLVSRIHFDVVETLGQFIEFEVMIEDLKSIEKGTLFAESLKELFELKDEDLIDVSYIDLILENKNN